MKLIEITQEQFEQNLEFIVDLCEKERVIWKVRLSTGEYIMCCPVVESAAPVPEHIIEQVEEFRRDFLANQA